MKNFLVNKNPFGLPHTPCGSLIIPILPAITFQIAMFSFLYYYLIFAHIQLTL